MRIATAVPSVISSMPGRLKTAFFVLLLLLGTTAHPATVDAFDGEPSLAASEDRPGPRTEKAEALRRTVGDLASPLGALATERRNDWKPYDSRRSAGQNGLFGVSFTGTGSASGCSTSPCTFPISGTSTLDAEFDTAPTTGSVTIVKDATPADGTNFTFSEMITSGMFTLDDAVPDDADAFTDTETFMSVSPGLYDVTEMAAWVGHSRSR